MSNAIRAMRDAFLATLVERMETDTSIVFISADFGSPVLDTLRERFPDRFINIGIAEQNLINVSAGMALEGYKVYAYAIAPFITMRCYEQIRVNLAILSQVRPMNVNLIGVGAGYSYLVSGPTHQCLEDLSIMRTLPNLTVLSPADWVTAEAFVDHTIQTSGAKYLRFDAKPMESIYSSKDAIDITRGFTHMRHGSRVAVIGTGYMTRQGLTVADSFSERAIPVGVFDLFRLVDFDKQALADALMDYESIISVEEGFIGKGGLDSLLLHLINDYDIQVAFKSIGLSDSYSFEMGDRESLHERSHAGRKHLARQIEEFLQ